jgi:hypothetical protein
LSVLCISKKIYGHRLCNQEGEETMLGANEQRSEVARLLSQISAEYEAAQRGLSGLSYGTSQHDFITARMENMGQLHNQLHSLVGDVAIAMIADQLNSSR